MANSKTNSGIITVTLPDDVMRSWSDAAQTPGVEYQEHGPHEDFIAEAVTTAASAHAFAPLTCGMEDLKNYRINAVVVKNVPVDPSLPSAPTDGLRPKAKSSFTERILLGLVNRYVDSYGYVEEKGGRLVHEVAPVPGMENSRSNAGREVFAAHMDNAFLSAPYRPFWLALNGLLNEKRVATWIHPLDPILQSMNPDDVATLHLTEFRLRCPESFNFAKTVWVPNRSLLERVSDRTIGGFNHGYNVEAMTPRAQRALDALNLSLDQAQPEQIVIEPGTMLVFNNTLVLHGRAKIESGGERWLQRTYGAADLGLLQRASGQKGRVFQTTRFLPMSHLNAA